MIVYLLIRRVPFKYGVCSQAGGKPFGIICRVKHPDVAEDVLRDS